MKSINFNKYQAKKCINHNDFHNQHLMSIGLNALMHGKLKIGQRVL